MKKSEILKDGKKFPAGAKDPELAITKAPCRGLKLSTTECRDAGLRIQVQRLPMFQINQPVEKSFFF